MKSLNTLLPSYDSKVFLVIIINEVIIQVSENTDRSFS